MTEPAQAIQALRALMPGAVITPGNPELVYYADDAATPQQNVLPTWYFPDATALVDGQQVSLRGYSTPAVEGFLPTADILAPANGSVFVRGMKVTLTGSIGGGQSPYSYTWVFDDGSSVTGSTSGGVVSLLISTLPMGHASDLTVTVRLRATDSNGEESEDILLGFNSSMADVAFGPRLVDNMRVPQSRHGSTRSPKPGCSPRSR